MPADPAPGDDRLEAAPRPAAAARAAAAGPLPRLGGEGASGAPLPDAAPDNWVDRFAPAAARPWLKLGRFDRPAGVWLLMLPGWQGLALAGALGAWPGAGLYLRFALGALLMRAAGCAWNDVVDRDVDARVARTAGRPVASGRVSRRAALAFLIVLTLPAFLILLSMNLAAVALGAGSLLLVAAYPFMKRVTWWPQAWLGLTFNWGALLGWAAAAGGPSALAVLSGRAPAVPPGAWPSVPDLLLYAAGLFWTLGYDTIYAVQDLEDDALAGVKSSARRLGAGVGRGVGLFYGVSVALLAAAGGAARLGPLFWILLVPTALLLARQAVRVRPDDPVGALALFRSNRTVGLLVVAALAAGALLRPA